MSAIDGFLPQTLVVAHRSAEVISGIRSSLPDAIEVKSCSTRRELREHYLALDDGMVISGVEFPDGDGLETLIAAAHDKAHPVVIVTGRRSLELVVRATQDHVMAYLLEPVDAAELHAAMVLAQQRFRQLEDLEAEVDDLRTALEDRKIVERAKGILMADKDLTEQDAYAMLRRHAQDRRVRLRDVARQIIEAHDAGA